MSKTTMPSFLAFALMALGLKEFPKDKDGKLSLNEEQDAKLSAEFGTNYEAFKKKANDFLAKEAGKDAEKTAARQKANADLEAALNADEDAGENDTEEKPEPSNNIEENAANAAQVIREQRATIDKLANQPEPDEVVRNLTTSMKKIGIAAMISATTATALFGLSGKTFAMDSPWNTRASLELSGKMAGTTDFSDVSNITRLNDDLKEYYVKNPEVLNELRKNRSGLPAFWPKRFNVVNMVSDAVMDVANVTQGRKPEWSPNPELFIEAEKRKIYPVQIDIEFTAEQLQQLETSWIHNLISMDGSSPYKLSFVAFLIKKIDDQARIEDRISAINGVYVFKPKGIKAKGSYLNRQNGLRYQLFFFRDIAKKITAFKSKLGAPTLANMYDYMNEYRDWLSEDVRKQLGLKWYLSRQALNAYHAGYKLANGLYQDYTGNDLKHIEGYPNLEFVVLDDLEGTFAMFITDSENIEIMEDVPNEKSIYRFEYLKRDTFVHADYKFAVAFKFAGFKLPADSSFLGLAQMIWVNDVPMFSENFHVPMYGAALSAPIEVNFTRVKTDINLLSDVKVINSTLTTGQIVKIVGNTAQLTTAKIIKKTGSNGGNLDLTADFDPKTGGYLTLLKTADGFKEVARTSAPEAAPATSLNFTGTTIDAKEGSEFLYKGTSSATLTDVLNGIEGAEVKIYGQATNTLTVATVAGKILITGSTSAVLDTAAKYIVLKKFDGLWIEIVRG